MNSTLTIELPNAVKLGIGAAARDEGVSETDFAAKALADYLYIRQFRNLRTKMMSMGKEEITDEQVFDLVS